jgi:surface protein
MSISLNELSSKIDNLTNTINNINSQMNSINFNKLLNAINITIPSINSNITNIQQNLQFHKTNINHLDNNIKLLNDNYNDISYNTSNITNNQDKLHKNYSNLQDKFSELTHKQNNNFNHFSDSSNLLSNHNKNINLINDNINHIKNKLQNTQFNLSKCINNINTYYYNNSKIHLINASQNNILVNNIAGENILNNSTTDIINLNNKIGDINSKNINNQLLLTHSLTMSDSNFGAFYGMKTEGGVSSDTDLGSPPPNADGAADGVADGAADGVADGAADGPPGVINSLSPPVSEDEQAIATVKFRKNFLNDKGTDWIPGVTDLSYLGYNFDPSWIGNYRNKGAVPLCKQPENTDGPLLFNQLDWIQTCQSATGYGTNSAFFGGPTYRFGPKGITKSELSKNKSEGFMTWTGDKTDKWDTQYVTNMDSMFDWAKGFNGNIGGWNTNNVTSMRYTFFGANSFQGTTIGSWNINNVNNMDATFMYTPVFNGDLSKWNTSKVTSMINMFSGARKFNSDINEWNVDNVTSMQSMFKGAFSFNKELGNWNTSNVQNMESMFQDTYGWKQGGWVKGGRWMISGVGKSGGIGNWNISKVKDMSYMLSFTNMMGSDGYITYDAQKGFEYLLDLRGWRRTIYLYPGRQGERTLYNEINGWRCQGPGVSGRQYCPSDSLGNSGNSIKTNALNYIMKDIVQGRNAYRATPSLWCDGCGGDGAINLSPVGSIGILYLPPGMPASQVYGNAGSGTLMQTGYDKTPWEAQADLINKYYYTGADMIFRGWTGAISWT